MRNSIDAFKTASNPSTSKPVQFNYKLNLSSSSTSKKLIGVIKIDTAGTFWMNGVSAGVGIEIFRVLVKNDSLYFLNRMSNEYYAGNNTLLNRFSGVDIPLNVLNKIFQGTLFHLAYNQLDNEYLHYSIDSNFNGNHYKYVFNITDTDLFKTSVNPQIDEDFLINKQGHLLESNYLFNGKNKQMKLSYDDVYLLNTIPQKLKVSMNTFDNNIQLDFSFYKLKFLEEFTYKYKVPEEYKEL